MEDRVTGRIIGCVIRVHSVLGPGFLESIYERAMVIELAKSGLSVEVEKEVEVRYESELVGLHRLDPIMLSSVPTSAPPISPSASS